MPSQEGHIQVSGGRVWFKIVGEVDATPLLVLHGGPGFPHDYLEPLETLSGERPVVFYDQLGCGRSDRPEDTSLWQTERFVQELGQVREALSLERVHIMGHSWGSMLATDYMLTEPAGVVSLILASPPLSIPRWLDDARGYRRELPLDVQRVLDEHEAAGTTDSEEYRAATREFYSRHVYRLDPLPEAIERMRAGANHLIYNLMWGPNEFNMTGSLADYDRTGDLHHISVPTLFTCGRYDEASPEATTWYHELVPGSEIEIFEHSAHMPHLSELGRYLDVLRRFLSRVDTQSSATH